MSKKNIRWDKRMAFAILSILHKNYDGKMSRRGLLKAVEDDEGDLIPTDKRANHHKWRVNVEYYCQKFVKAGFLQMYKGTWTLTEQGAKSLADGESAVIAKADESYANFRRERKRLKQQGNNGSLDANLGTKDDVDTGSGDDSDEGEFSPEKGDIPSDPESDARDEIEEYILSLDWIYFQELCAALLRGMGYHVSYVAPPGPDGGIDVVAGKDPLSCEPPRIKLQAKRQVSNVSLDVITKLEKVLTKGDVGIAVSASGFSSNCRGVASSYPGNHIELIDMNRLVDLWQEHYDNLSEKDKALLPLQKVYFLNKKGIKKES